MGRAFAIVLCVVVSGGSAAAATAPRIDIDSPDSQAHIERARLELTPHREHMRAELTLWLASTETIGRDVQTRLAFTHGSRVVDMAITLGEGPRVPAVSMETYVADRQYRRIVRGNRDPALLQLEVATRSVDTYTVRAFPIDAAHTARIEIVIELPLARKLDLAMPPIDMVDVIVDGVAQRSGALDRPLAIAVPAPPKGPLTLRTAAAVSKRSSLFAGEPVRPQPPPEPGLSETLAVIPARAPLRVSVNVPPSTAIAIEADAPSVSAHEVRAVASKHVREIGECFATRAAASDDPIAVRFAVLPTGRVAAVSVGGRIADTMKTCIAERVATWSFGDGQELAMATVNVPLQLRAL